MRTRGVDGIRSAPFIGSLGFFGWALDQSIFAIYVPLAANILCILALAGDYKGGDLKMLTTSRVEADKGGSLGRG